MKGAVLTVLILCAAAVAQDTDPPYVDGLDPGDHDYDIPIYSDIIFHCKDDGVGVDLETIDFRLDDFTLGYGPAVSASAFERVGFLPTRRVYGELYIDDSDPNDVVCTFTPDDPLDSWRVYKATVYGSLADEVGNEMGEDFVWIFSTTYTDDTEPPFVSGLNPDDGEESVPPRANIVFICCDYISGIDVTTIDFTARDSSLSSISNTALESYNGIIDGILVIDDSDLCWVTCTFEHHKPLPLGDTITCTVDGCLADLWGNVMGADFTWSFQVSEEQVDETTWGEVKAREW
jgi:hypothetical protein